MNAPRIRIAFVAALMTIVLAACPAPSGRIVALTLDDVERHLDLRLGTVPEDCQPQGLFGDGRGKMVGATFDCSGAVVLIVERFDGRERDAPLPGSPAASSANRGRIEWRDGASGDVVVVRSNEADPTMLLDVARSIDVP